MTVSRKRQLEDIREVSSQVGQQGERPLLDLLAQKALELTGATGAAVALLDDDRQMMSLVAAAGENSSELLGLKVRVDDCLNGRAVRPPEPYIAYEEGQEQPKSGIGTGIGVRSAVVVPIVAGADALGSLAIINRKDGQPFTEDDVRLLSVFASFAAMSIRSYRLSRLSRQQRHELDVLYTASRAVSSGLNLQEVLATVLRLVSETVEHFAAMILLLNDDRTRMSVAAAYGLTENERQVTVTAGEGLPALVLETGKPLLVADTDQEPRFEQLVPRARCLSAMLSPLRTKNRPLGVIIVTSLQRNAYNGDDLNMLTAVAAQSAIAIENAQLYEDATRRAEEATAIYRLSQAVNSSRNMEEIYQLVIESVLNLLHVDKVAVFLYSKSEQRLAVVAHHGLNELAAQDIKPQIGQGVAGWVVEFGTPIAIEDVRSDRINETGPIEGEGVISMVSVPLQIDTETFGCIHAMSTRPRRFTVAEVELMYTLANQVAIALTNIRMFQEAQKKAAALRKYVYRVARALGSEPDVEKIPLLVANLTTQVMEADACVIYSIENDLLVPRAVCNLPEEILGTERIRKGEGLVGWVARSGKSLAAAEMLEDPRASDQPFDRRRGMTSLLAIPLKVGRSTQGVLCVYTARRREFTREEIQFMLTFGSQATVALENARLIEESGSKLAELDRLQKEAEVLSRVSGIISRGQALEPLLDALVREVESLEDVDACVVSLPADSGLLVRSAYQDAEAGVGDIGVSEEAIRKAAREGQPVLISDFNADPGPNGIRTDGFRAMTGSPLIAAGRPIGMLAVFSRRPHAFTDREAQFIASLAGFVAMAVEQARKAVSAGEQ
ncbi:MAG: GAF domain-containing protein [Armatimonadetes bacterium]|nr:GAF domain-containing protein [Armatimonadota bacterium]